MFGRKRILKKTVKRPKKVYLALGGYAETTTETTDTYDSRNVDDQSLREVWYNSGEPGFWADREAEYHENPWYRIMVNYIKTMLTPDEFSGPGAYDCEIYFDEIDKDAWIQFSNLIAETCKYGTGFMYKASLNGKLRDMKTAYTRNFSMAFRPYMEDADYSTLGALYGDKKIVDISYIRVFDNATGVNYWFKNWPQLTEDDLRNDQLAMLRLEEDPASPYGIALVSSCWNELKGLKYMDRDILSGLNRMLSSPVLISADIDSVDDDQKQAVLDDVQESFDNIKWNKINAIAIDKRNTAGYMANHPGSSGSVDGRMIKPLDIAEPVFTAMILSFSMSLGIILQTGANKSIIDRQEALAEAQINQLRKVVNTFFKTQLAPHITKKPVSLKFNKKFNMDTLVNMFQTSAITREKFWEKAGIEDDSNGTFLIDEGKVPMGNAKEKSPTNNEDGV